MAIRSKKSIPIIVWIPPVFNPIYKIEVVTSSTTYDITDITTDAEFIDGVTDTIGSFSVKMDNSAETYTNLFSLSDEIKLYLDYGDTASTLRFVGVIERISKQSNNIVLTGRSNTVKTTGTMVTYSATSVETSVIIEALIDKYFDGIITKNNINVSSTSVTVNWYQKPFWECIIELCNASSFDAYIDNDDDMHYFESGSVVNSTEKIVHDYNLLETGDFSPDLTFVINKVQVYGAQVDGLPLFATAEDSTSQTSYGLKEEKITDSNITSYTQAQARADYELSIKKDPPTIGEITSLGLPTLAPGEKIAISDPENGIQPTNYTITKYSHKFSNDEPFKTVVTILKERSSIPKILKKRLKFEQESSAQDNPEEYEFGKIYDFNASEGTFSDTMISQGFLKTTGGASGNWVSPLITAASNVTTCEVRAKGSQIEGTTFFASSDGGITWQSIDINTPKTLDPSGVNLKVKVQINSATTQIDTVCFMYKT